MGKTKNWRNRKMKKVMKSESKKGFSLIEMVMVLAIICILAGSMIYGGLKILDRVKNICIGDSPVTSYNAVRDNA